MQGDPFDVAIIGGSFAGLAAALQLARAGRRTVVIDAGAPRTRYSSAVHGVPGWDGVRPHEVLDAFSADLAVYPSVSLRNRRAVHVAGRTDAFTVETDDDGRIAARRIVLAHGVRDVLPEIPGLVENWGRTVLHCPYCHGHEVRGCPLAVLATSSAAAHQARLLRADWSESVTLLAAGREDIDAAVLAADGIAVERQGLSSVQAERDGLTLSLSDGSRRHVAALFLAPRTAIAGSPAEQLGCTLDDGPTGPYVQVGPMKQTSVAGVFAAGDLAAPMPNVNLAIADGVLAGGGCHASLVFPGTVQWLARDAAA